MYALSFLGLGLLYKRTHKNTQDFLHAHRSLSLWLVSLAFLASNCSALEVVTMLAVSAKYGVLAVHFYWIGAIPALVFLLTVLLPRYQQVQLRSVPDYLGSRFSPSTKLLSALSFSGLMVVVAGIALCLTSRILHFVFGLAYAAGIWMLVGMAAAFLMTGGLRAVIYTEAFQLIIFLLVLAPLSAITLHHAGGIFPILSRLPDWQRHTFRSLSLVSVHDRFDLTGTLLGLGLCLSFTYWCGDFTLVQRLCAARDKDMLQTPRLALIAKLVMPLLLVLPGLGLMRVAGFATAGSYDLALPLLLREKYPPLLSILALSTLCASCFLGVCSNLTVAAAVYSSSIAPVTRRVLPLTDRGVLLILCISSGVAGLFSFRSPTLMESLQLSFSMLNVPVACVLLAGVLSKRISKSSGTLAILAGTLAGLVHWQLAHLIHYGSALAESFYGAILTTFVTVSTLVLLSWLRAGPQVDNPPQASLAVVRPIVLVAGGAILSMLILYAVFF